MGSKKYKEKEIKQIIDNIVIVIDTAEKNMPNHIARTLDKYNIKWERSNLDSGDYSAYVLPIDELNFEGIDFRNELVIERKNSNSEIITNLTKYKTRFHKEFDRTDAKIIIMIEDTYKSAAHGDFKNNVTPKQYLGLLHTLSFDKDSPVVFIDKEVAALYIYNTFKYYLRHKLKALKLE